VIGSTQAMSNAFGQGEQTMTTEERLTRLERMNRRLTLALVFMGLAATLVVAAGTGQNDAVPEVVKARSFVLVDGNGKMRALLQLDKDGPSLELCGENEKPRLRLAASKSGAGVFLGGENGKARVGLIVNKDGPHVGLYDENGRLLRSLP
jgi:hypothetical protein